MKFEVSMPDRFGRHSMKYSDNLTQAGRTNLLAIVGKTYRSVHALIEMVNCPISLSGSLQNMTEKNIALITSAAVAFLKAKDELIDMREIELNAVLDAPFEDLTDACKIEKILAKAKVDEAKRVEQTQRVYQAARQKFIEANSKTGLNLSVLENSLA